MSGSSNAQISTKPTKRSPELAQKIASLQLRLAPLVPLPAGDPHPAFPQTMLAYHLLTEEELDSIAHHYHQSTPSIWTYQYPASMNWDKEWLNASKQRRRSSLMSSSSRRQSRAETADQTQMQDVEVATSDEDWLTVLAADGGEPHDDHAVGPMARRRSSSARPSKGMTDAERIAVKRRKVGKFIGLIGMDTPADEIENRMRFLMEQVIQARQEELRVTEEWYLRRRKIG